MGKWIASLSVAALAGCATLGVEDSGVRTYVEETGSGYSATIAFSKMYQQDVQEETVWVVPGVISKNGVPTLAGFFAVLVRQCAHGSGLTYIFKDPAFEYPVSRWPYNAELVAGGHAVSKVGMDLCAYGASHKIPIRQAQTKQDGSSI